MRAAGLRTWLEAKDPGLRAVKRSVRVSLATVLGFQVGRPFDALVGMSWLLTGACLAWLRPRNALGWLLIGIGGCQVFGLLAAAYGSLGVFVGDPDWPGARWAAWLSSVLWIPGLLPLANVLIALYPDGRLPGPRWRWPVGAGAKRVRAPLGIAVTRRAKVVIGSAGTHGRVAGLPGSVVRRGSRALPCGRPGRG